MDYKITEQPMISAAGQILESVYDRYEDPKKPGFYWFVRADVENKAEHILFGSPNYTGSQGMGGRTIPIKCTDGTTIDIQGPWWSNSDALFSSTGIDVRNTVLSFVVISRDIKYDRDGDVLIDVVYKDDAPTIGPWDRHKIVAKDVFEALPEVDKLVLYHRTQGGCSYGFKTREKILNDRT
jgi:hypothetical protein